MTTQELSERKVAGSEHQPLDPLTARERLHNLRQVRQFDPAIKEMIGLNQDTNTARTLVEAARLADPRAELGQPPGGHLCLQGLTNFFGAACRARTLGVLIRAAVGADKEIAFSQRHARRFAARPGYFKRIARLIVPAICGRKRNCGDSGGEPEK